MTRVESPVRALAIAVIEQAVEDYVTLRELGCVTGTEVDRSRWRYEIGSAWRYAPLRDYSSARKVAELIEFLMGPYFEKFCDCLSTEEVPWQAWRFRQRLGLVPGASSLLTRADLWWIMTPSHMMERQHLAANGSRFDEIPLYNAAETATEEESHAA